MSLRLMGAVSHHQPAEGADTASESFEEDSGQAHPRRVAVVRLFRLVRTTCRVVQLVRRWRRLAGIRCCRSHILLSLGDVGLAQEALHVTIDVRGDVAGQLSLELVDGGVRLQLPGVLACGGDFSVVVYRGLATIDVVGVGDCADRMARLRCERQTSAVPPPTPAYGPTAGSDGALRTLAISGPASGPTF